MRIAVPVVGLLALALGACGQAQDAPQAPPSGEATQAASPSAPAKAATPSAAAVVALDADGLRFVTADTGRTSLLAFGAKRAMVEAAVARATGGKPQRSVSEECPAGPTQFTRFGELQLAFQEGLWIGWALGGASPVTTMDGIGIGSTRAEVERTRNLTMIPESTLDEEFVLGSAEQETAIGGVFATPGPEGRVAYLWAGVACNFR